jgi:hypothetical protein
MLRHVYLAIKKESSNICFIENNQNIPKRVQDEGCPVKFYDWKTFLKQYFKTLSALTTYHHFRVDKESHVIVFVKEYYDSMEKEFRLLKKRVVIDSYYAICVTEESTMASSKY